MKKASQEYIPIKNIFLNLLQIMELIFKCKFNMKFINKIIDGNVSREVKNSCKRSTNLLLT